MLSEQLKLICFLFVSYHNGFISAMRNECTPMKEEHRSRCFFLSQAIHDVVQPFLSLHPMNVNLLEKHSSGFKLDMQVNSTAYPYAVGMLCARTPYQVNCINPWPRRSLLLGYVKHHQMLVPLMFSFEQTFAY